MRPARKGPENRGAGGERQLTGLDFNEAGPQGAGKPTGEGGSRNGSNQLQ